MSEPFLFIAGHPALDFLNTQQKNSKGEWVELLPNASRVAAWLSSVAVGSVALSESSESLVADALALRGVLRALITAWTEGESAPPEPLAFLNKVLATGTWRPVLTSNFTPNTELVATAPHPLLPIAHAAMDLLARHDRTLVRCCAGEGCVLWFLDTTKNKRRRWCTMEACGNREKQAAHYRRIKGRDKGT